MLSRAFDVLSRFRSRIITASDEPWNYTEKLSSTMNTAQLGAPVTGVAANRFL
jgi:hypothetical protein